MEHSQTAARAARRFLTDRVRSDWDWPSIPECWSASDEEVRGISEFRERYYGTSSSETDATSDDPYQFDSPDSIGDAVERKLRARKRRRRVAMEEEAKWNKGLACFVARQEAWTGAAAVKKYGTNRPPKGGEILHGDKTVTPTSVSSDPPSVLTSSMVLEVPSSNNSIEPLLPVALPLLSGNTIRSSITSKTYPDIYNKIVVTSRTPLVPINLADMTKALVQGWKDNGEWPPKATPLDPLAGRKRALANARLEDGDGQFLSHHPHVKKGMESVKRIFHLNGNTHENGVVGQHG